MAKKYRSPEGEITSGHSHSYWIDSVEPLKFESLSNNLEADVVIVGAGISGLTVGYCLSESGKKIIILEDGFIGSGETGRTTAHIVNALDDRYSELEKYHGEDGSRLAAESHTAAIDFVESTIKKENIDCEFRRVDGYLFLHESDEPKTLEDELAASQRAGVQTTLLNQIPGIRAKGPCLHFPNQGQFHPMKYIQGLAHTIIKNGGQIYTNTHVTEIRKHKVIAGNYTVKAKHIVVATNTPINNRVTMHTKQFPYRTYVIGATIPKGTIAPALWWDTGDQQSVWVTNPYNYVRLTAFNDQFDLLICGGADHKTGQADTEHIPEEERFGLLEKWAKQKFPDVVEVVYRWSGQVMEPLDSLGFIGKNPGDDDTYIVTGDSGNGMTHGTIAGILITDLIHGRKNPWEKLYSPGRITMKAAGDYLKEVGNMTAQYIDFLAPGDIESAKELSPGNGGILAVGFKKVAVYRDEAGEVHAYSAICPHLGCVLQWNGEEKSFDCPCHGSRFTCEGKVINGPASTDLRTIVITEKMKA